jgi:hypothetical protein
MPLNAAGCRTRCAASPNIEDPPVERQRGTVLRTLPRPRRLSARSKPALAMATATRVAGKNDGFHSFAGPGRVPWSRAKQLDVDGRRHENHRGSRLTTTRHGNLEISDTRKFAMIIRLKAIPGKEPEIEALLGSALLVAQEEHATNSWFAVRCDSSTFGIFCTFPNEDSLEGHLCGLIGTLLAARTSELFAQPPFVERVDVLGAKP